MKVTVGIEFGLVSSLDPFPKKDPLSSTKSVSDSGHSRGNSKALTESDYRLVIERNPNTGSYIYKTLNAYTGEVVSQRPAESVAKLGESAGYVPGSMVNSKA